MYNDFSNISSHPIVVLHGWGQSKQYWQTFADSFQPGEVITLDLPGFGDEPLVSPEWGIPEYAQWVKAKLGGMNLPEVILLGHSFGGRISSLIASENPAWLKGLILYGAPSIYRPSPKVKSRIRTAKLLKRLGIKVRLTNNPQLVEADKSGLGKVFRNVVNFDQTDKLPQITVPTLLVWGEHDEEVPLPLAQEMKSLIPNSKLAVLDKLGHNAHLENPTLFYGTIKRFIENL